MQKIHKISLLIFLPCYINLLHADESGLLCSEQLQKNITQTQSLSLKVNACLAAKFSELDNFNTKRLQYTRLVHWIEFFGDPSAKNELLNAIKERDILLTSKLENFANCVSDLKNIQVPEIQKQTNTACGESLAASQKTLEGLKAYESDCDKCNIGAIGEGYAKSPVEILVAQTKDARDLRDTLYDMVSYENTTVSLNKSQKWQLMRDIVIPHVEDKATEMEVSSRIMQLVEKLGDSVENQENFSVSSDNTIAAYAAFAQLLQAKSSESVKRSQEMLNKLAAVAIPVPSNQSHLQYFGVQDTAQLQQIILELNDEQRSALIQSINAAVKTYGQWK